MKCIFTVIHVLFSFSPKLQQQHFCDDVVLIDFNQHHEAVYRQAARRDRTRARRKCVLALAARCGSRHLKLLRATLARCGPHHCPAAAAVVVMVVVLLVVVYSAALTHSVVLILVSHLARLVSDGVARLSSGLFI